MFQHLNVSTRLWAHWVKYISFFPGTAASCSPARHHFGIWSRWALLEVDQREYRYIFNNSSESWLMDILRDSFYMTSVVWVSGTELHLRVAVSSRYFCINHSETHSQTSYHPMPPFRLSKHPLNGHHRNDESTNRVRSGKSNSRTNQIQL